MSEPFCSRLAEAAHGVIVGTGVRGEIYAFLPVDKKRWGRGEFNESWATPEELDAIKRARRAGVIVRLYVPPAKAARPKVLAYRGPDASAGAIAALQTVMSDLSRHPWDLDDTAAPRLVLCTQGTRDRCCAKWGFAVFRAAQALWTAGRMPFEPIECSHLGGDRFAATGIVFPSGSMYGHLDHVDLTDLTEAEIEGRILQAHYRGRVFDTPLTQVVRAGLAEDGFHVTTVSPLNIEDPQAEPLRVRSGDQTFEVSLMSKDYQFFGDCRAVARNRPSTESRPAYLRAREVCASTRAITP